MSGKKGTDNTLGIILTNSNIFVVISCKEYHEGNAKLLYSNKSNTPIIQTPYLFKNIIIFSPINNSNM